MKRLLSILIAIALMATMSVTAFAVEEPTLYVAGVAVTSDNLEINSADNGAITGSATYDPDSNTLTLNNFSYTNAADVDAIISDGMNLTIALKGENAFSVGGRGIWVENGTLTISDSDEDDTVGSLEMISGLDAFGDAIYSGGSISIDGVELLAACDGASSTRTDPTFAIFSETVSIKDSTVTVRVLNVQNGLAIMASTLTVKNSTVEANGTYGAILDSATFSHSGVSGLVPTLNGKFIVTAGNDAASAVKVDSPTDATYANKYVRIEPAELEPETQTTTITYQVDPTYTVTIPPTVALGETATIKAENVVLAKGKQVEVSIADANGFKATTPEGAELTYTVKNGETAVAEGDTVLAVNPKDGKAGETTLSFVAPETIQYAGTYTGSATFTISVKDVPMINFTLDTSYIGQYVSGLTTNLQAEAGMTWGEWIESKYNVDGYVIEESWGLIVPAKDWAITDGGYPNYVEYTDEIIANHTYDFSITAG